MKKYLLALTLLFPLTSFAMAGVVQVNNTVQNINRVGTLKSSDMSSVIEYKNGSLTQSGSGYMQLYNLENSNISPTDYEVRGPFIPNYEYTTAGDCKGSVYDDKVKICFLQWTDTGPAEAPIVRESITPPVVSDSVVASSQAVVVSQDEQISALRAQLIDLLIQLINLLKLQLVIQQNGTQTI